MSDRELLQQYVREGSQEAFASLVTQHLNLVYSAARRQVTSAQLAEEVAQSVFLELARQAAGIKPRTPLPAWLYVVTRRIALNTRRGEMRRLARERAAYEIAAVNASAATLWPQVEPLLDEAVATLGTDDRSAILLRYFENKSLREIADALGTSEDTAQKRVSRALDRLRAFFQQRGVTATSALAATLSANAVQAAPAGLAGAIAATPALAALAAATGTGAPALIVSGIAKIAAGLVAAVLLGTTVWEATLLARERDQIRLFSTRVSELDSTLTQVQRERDRAAGELRDTRAEIARLAAMPTVELDAEVAAWFARVARLHELVAQQPGQTIPEFALLQEKDWFQAGRDATFDTDEERQAQLQGLRMTARERLMPRLHSALIGYVDAHDGQLPEAIEQLAPYASPPLDPAILARYKMVQQGNLDDLPTTDWLIAERTSVDEANDRRFFLQRRNSGSALFTDVNQPDLRLALESYLATNGGQFPTTPAQLLPLFRRPPSPLAMKSFLALPADEFTPEVLRKLLPSE